MAATSCGISVICTRVATIQPMTPPTATRISDNSHRPEPGPISVAATASAMPTMPYQTARLALSWPESPPRDRMNRMAATT
ncbi:hypothetical protein PAAM106076_11780 [Paracoccus aminovorans]